ncbi:MAG: hypothetical protein KA159_02490 [Halioglobus sp.]|nr:hypothetical protein [Halioglobus sp.]MBP6723862.1 hypothetical protein [Halioglobus sp.]
MHKSTARMTTFALAVAALLGSTAAPAQEQRWFRVELVVFANNSPPPRSGAAAPEQWDATPTLSYPEASRFLVDPAQVAGNNAKLGGYSVLDEYGRQTLSKNPPPPGTNAPYGQTAAPPPAVTAPIAAPAPVPPSPVYEGGAAPGAQPAAAALPVVPGALPRPWVALPQSYRELSDKVAQMQRSGRYSILFHETWVQELESQETSLPIVLDRSGDSRQWPQLQGTIKPYLTRYLELETNLWLNTAGEYLPGTWRMPAPPFGPRSLIIEEEQVVDVAAAVAALPAAGAATAEAQEIAPVYPYRHAVLLQQTGRMRSGEAHYIDHPMLGVIIKFTPVTGEQLASIAAQEAATLGANQPR